MSKSIQIPITSASINPDQLLLALALELRQHIPSKSKMTIVIAKSVYELIDRNVLEEILYDHLLTLDNQLEERLTILIKQVNYLAIEWPLKEIENGTV
jgi:hypothetical protein